MASDSAKYILYAIAANIDITLYKSTSTYMTGSRSMLAEVIHKIAIPKIRFIFFEANLHK